MLTWISNTYYFVLALCESAWRATRRLGRTLPHSRIR